MSSQTYEQPDPLFAYITSLFKYFIPSSSSDQPVTPIVATAGTIVLAIIMTAMFSDSIKGSVDMASASVKYYYDKATTRVLGSGTFDESELSTYEKHHDIQGMRKLHVGGLYNEGNTCFINSVVQSMASLEFLDEFLAERTPIVEEEDVEMQDADETDAKESHRHVEGKAHKDILNGLVLPGSTPGSRSASRAGSRAGSKAASPRISPSSTRASSPAGRTSRFSMRARISRPSTPKEPEAPPPSLVVTLASLLRTLNQKLEHAHTYSTGSLVKSLGADLGREPSWLAGFDQEDAQEFFQQVLLCLEKEIKSSGAPQSQAWARRLRERRASNFSTTRDTNALFAVKQADGDDSAVEDGEATSDLNKSNDNLVTPFDGIFATRVGCVKCGETEGIRRGTLSSVDLSLQSGGEEFGLDELLAEYCQMETIPGVECYRCTLHDFRNEVEAREKQQRLSMMRKMYRTRLEEIDAALADPVIDEAKYAKLKPTKVKALGDKTKQTMFAIPSADVMMIHINRSVFDMRTGFSRKNYAPIDFPLKLDLSAFTVDTTDKANLDPSKAMKSIKKGSVVYNLRATVIHYGSHNFGHYVCYRKCSQGFWWRISDHSVDLTTEAQVLRTREVFMLFYERDQSGGEGEDDSEQVEAEMENEKEKNDEDTNENDVQDEQDEHEVEATQLDEEEDVEDAMQE